MMNMVQILIRSSSMVEQLAVNETVPGSSPGSGANLIYGLHKPFLECPILHIRTFDLHHLAICYIITMY